MAKVDPHAVMVLRRLTDLPVSMCRDALIEAGGDLSAVVEQFRNSPCNGWYASDAEIAVVLAANGVSWTPVKREPKDVPDSEVVAELTFGGQSISDFFLLNGLVCHSNTRGVLSARIIDDPDLAGATRDYLRRIGAREFESLEEFQEWRRESSC